MIASLFSEHLATVKGVAGLTLAGVAATITPILTVIVLLLTAWNLLLEIRKKQNKG